MPFTPKHQRKVNEIYPTRPGEEGPVSGKISALYHYLNARPAKINKVIAYLQKKVQRDLYKERVGYNKVTLEILEAIFSNCAAHFAIFSYGALDIIHSLLSCGEQELTIRAISTVNSFFNSYNA